MNWSPARAASGSLRCDALTDISNEQCLTMGTILEPFNAAEKLQPFFKGIDEFCGRHLQSERVDEDEGSPKTFADPVEGYASFAAWEVRIIDTPLFQRLREIRQLGLAYLVYPTLGYSRFEHTIGVSARLSQVLRSLDENRKLEEGENQTPISDSHRTAARLACLFHDIGHCVFSHVSESVMEELTGTEQYPSSKVISDAFSDYARKRIPMAEVLAVSILTSQRFVNFLDKIPVHYQKGRKQLAIAAAHLVMGLPIPGENSSLFLAQLMSSGLDVDKLDYMMRESHFTGITLGVSLDWLLKKLFVRQVPAAKLPNGLRARIKNLDSANPYSVLGLRRGGQFAFEEFCIARLALHEKIYLHQKIRAAEAAMRNELGRLSKRDVSLREVHRWLDLNEATMALPTDDRQGHLFDQPHPVLERFRTRRLPFRAYGFGWPNTISEKASSTPTSPDSLTGALVKSFTTDSNAFIARIRDNLRLIKTALSREKTSGAQPDFDPDEIQILPDPAKTSSIQQGHDTIYFEQSKRLSLRWTMPIDTIADSYLGNRALNYIFCEEKAVPYVMLATELAIWKEFQAIYVQDVCVNSRSLKKADDLRKRLHQLGLYEEAKALRPASEILTSLEAQDAALRIASRLTGYHPRTKRYVSQVSVTTYVSQFPEHLQPAALEWLDRLELVPHDTLILSTLEDLRRRRPFGRFGFVPLGSPRDSAGRIAYDLREDLDDDQIQTGNVRDTLAEKLEAYVVYDDNINSGKQAINIVASWMGVTLPDKRRIPDFMPLQPFSQTEQTEFRSKPVYVIFAISTEGACARLKRELIDLCGFRDDLVTVSSGRTLLESERLFSGSQSPFQHAKRIELRDYLNKVAVEIFMSEGKSREHAEEMALGYNGAQAMVVFSHNCPTMTVPALWLSGVRASEQWHPLVERTRRKDPKSGQFKMDDV
jgi:deoxynucleoside triphosphate triphosphohydrolase SAMHD1